MNERNLTVIGSYSTREEALSVIEQLRDEGYDRDDIIIYMTKDAAQNFGFSGLSGIDVETNVDEVEGTHEERSLWERIKDTFTSNTYEEDSYTEKADDSVNDDPLYSYKEDIAAGKIVITVKDYKAPNEAVVENDRTQNMPDPTDTLNTNNENIQLKEEQLDVNTHDVTTGEVDIHKHVVNDTKTVEVPVKREEIVIERKPVNAEASDNISDDSLEDETITIPLKEEQIDVNKHTVVREEVGIHKKGHEDMKQVTEEVSREELDIDTKGDVRVEDTDENTRKNDHI
ncbi:DUF2382 domain-containing protein [Enterococcus hirae]|uniref:DUF2382 domain-containing protein n=1 Tax=Enterococcus hirae TaxID=1354 RepID=UPI000B53AA67|nr:DUF2382 domain-containing protein [Enterococcus hirae]OWW64087.1 hypothetical protein F521_04100 [Enterococcus hirae 67-03-C5]EMF0048141.1 DUF2382 domain-containing protein [Enterococcus hirae]EMF0116613.1 DUF2382 domain-containing protein [Enterococcus hirae]EMF0153504.1 DUF2382 domain-containing protein [Enterococcus hirae]EMF0176934.1 DUF2382 domain-containing protein [Enterococcus hirae]